MNFMEYSNEKHINIIPKDAFEELTREVFQTVSENISKSLGPLGSSATILDGALTEATKDGYAIFKSYRFHNRYKKMIYNLMKAPCTRLNNTVGDGTTTAIVFASKLYRRYMNRKGNLETLYRLPRTFVQTWDDMIEEISEEVRNRAVSIDPNDRKTIYNICYVTSNGNDEISNNIANVYAETPSPVIKQKDSPTNKSYIVPVGGFDFEANLIDEGYVKNEDLSVEEKEPCILIFDYKIESEVCEQFLIPLNDALRAQNKKLVVFAPFYDAFLCNTTLKQYMNHEYQKYGALNLILCQYSTGKLPKHQLTDLATVLRTFVINQDLFKDMKQVLDGTSVDLFIEDVMENESHPYYRLFGTCDSVMLSCTNGTLFKVSDIESDERYQDVLRAAKKELEDIKAKTDYEKQSFAAKIYEANLRVSQLQMNNYIYYIGANSSLQKKITWDSVEDVIKCVRSAIKHGTVPGCQLTIYSAAYDIMQKIVEGKTDEEIKSLSNEDKLKIVILDLIQDAVCDTYTQVLYGPEGMGIIKTIDMWQYIGDDGVEELKNRAIAKMKEIITKSIEQNQVFDLEHLCYDPTIITSAETDVMVLRAASDLVKILISGNQCIFLDVDVNETHNETQEIYA